MTEPRKLTPQEEARLAQVRKQFQERKEISDKLNAIKTRIGVYSGKGGVGKTTIAVNLAVILAQEAESYWLDPAIDDQEVLASFLRPFPADAMVTYEVTRRVNTPPNDDLECIRPVPQEESRSAMRTVRLL